MASWFHVADHMVTRLASHIQKQGKVCTMARFSLHQILELRSPNSLMSEADLFELDTCLRVHGYALIRPNSWQIAIIAIGHFKTWPALAFDQFAEEQHEQPS